MNPLFNRVMVILFFSVQNQKLKEYELIFVDDFSFDNGTKIIKKIKEKDKRIKLIKKKNGNIIFKIYW